MHRRQLLIEDVVLLLPRVVGRHHQHLRRLASVTNHLPYRHWHAGLETSTLHKGIVGLQRKRLAGVPAGHLPVDQQRLALAVGHQPQHHKGLLAGVQMVALDHGRAMAAKQRDDAVDQPVDDGVLRPQVV